MKKQQHPRLCRFHFLMAATIPILVAVVAGTCLDALGQSCRGGDGGSGFDIRTDGILIVTPGEKGTYGGKAARGGDPKADARFNVLVYRKDGCLCVDLKNGRIVRVPMDYVRCLPEVETQP